MKDVEYLRSRRGRLTRAGLGVAPANESVVSSAGDELVVCVAKDGLVVSFPENSFYPCSLFR